MSFSELISIHTLREEGDSSGYSIINRSSEFLSTPSARRVTTVLRQAPQQGLISIHTLREEGDVAPPAPPAVAGGISIHTLREEGDMCWIFLLTV